MIQFSRILDRGASTSRAACTNHLSLVVAVVVIVIVVVDESYRPRSPCMAVRPRPWQASLLVGWKTSLLAAREHRDGGNKSNSGKKNSSRMWLASSEVSHTWAEQHMFSDTVYTSHGFGAWSQQIFWAQGAWNNVTICSPQTDWNYPIQGPVLPTQFERFFSSRFVWIRLDGFFSCHWIIQGFSFSNDILRYRKDPKKNFLQWCVTRSNSPKYCPNVWKTAV